MAIICSSSLFALPTATYGTCKGEGENATNLQVLESEIIVDGKSSKIYKLIEENGSWYIQKKEGECFNVTVENFLTTPTTVHWHGLILPNAEDGVAYVTQPPIAPGNSQNYNFEIVQSGTYWAHSHYGLEEQKLLACPLIIYPKEGPKYHDVICFLQDFTFKGIDEVWQGLRKKFVEEAKTKGDDWIPSFAIPKVTSSTPDVIFDAFLTNGQTLEKPDVQIVQPGEKVRIRVINGSSASNYEVDIGELKGEIIAADGNPVDSLELKKFPIAVAQRYDVLVTIPEKGGAFPILATCAQTNMRTGLILKTEEAKEPEITSKTQYAIGNISNNIEKQLHSKDPLKPRKVDRHLKALLQGNRDYYTWAINGFVWPHSQTLFIKEGERVEMELTNDSPMSHPMHLHGHFFQVMSINGQNLKDGAMRDTILVMPNQTVKIQFDANNPGIWAFHCHIIYHLWAGMFTVVQYEGITPPYFSPEEIETYSQIYGGY